MSPPKPETPGLHDFHMHTVFSDGSAEPEELLQAVADHGVSVVAVTDHDTTAGYERLKPKADALNLTLIPGIEINTHWKGTEVHVLGYFIDFDNDYLKEVTLQHRTDRISHIKKLVEKIRKQTNAQFTYDDVLSLGHPEGSLGRPHVAKALMQRRDVSSISEAFTKYLKSDAPTYVSRPTVTPHEAVEAIHDSGGVPVIAHPGQAEGIENLVPELLGYGLGGLEAYHKSHSSGMVEYFCTMAESNDLIVTGGTDFHGVPSSYANSRSRLFMPERIYDDLKARWEGQHRAAFKVS